MQLSDFDYNLPQKFIAQKPSSPRDHCRLMVLNKKRKNISHTKFYKLPDFLIPGDLLIFNNTKVIPARLWGHKETGGKIEILLLHEIKEGFWEVLLNRKISVGSKINISNNFWGEILALPVNNSKWKIKFNLKRNKFKKYLNKYGEMPLPPYIKSARRESKLTKKQYQTIYANARKEGSVAAPTAGLHFTERLIKKLKDKKVQIEFITLQVGLGTFEPVRTNDPRKHRIHSELIEIKKNTLKKIVIAKQEGRRIISVGTTTARVLESLPNKINTTKDFNKWTNIFIYPGYKFKYLDGIITNFHLPKSTLLMMVSALAGSDLIKTAYREAISNKYRFYSYGDGMLIL